MGMMGAGGQMALRAGLRQRIEDQLRRRMEEQQMALAARGADRADRALDEQTALRQTLEADRVTQQGIVNADRDLTQNRALDEANLPGFYPAPNPIMGRLEKIGAATHQAPTLESTKFDGMSGQLRMAPDPGLPEGWNKRESAGQANIRTDNERAAVAEERAAKDLDRREAADKETAKYHEGMLNKPSGQSTVIVRDFDPETGKGRVRVEPRVPGASYDTNLLPTADARNRESAKKRVQPLLDAITELSPRINTKQGMDAVFAGGWNKVQAAANYDDDVAEYVAVVEAFTPLLARAEGHTGVLTEADFTHAMRILPGLKDSGTLAQRKIARLNKILFGDETSAAAPAKAGSKIKSITEIK
jgi:hypothetical protein